ncbi:MAG: MoaD/ThiS family protein [Caldisericota bacterium]|jgi:molybdopterin converting factor small subunit|nr:MoaD/ThiS family protein [Caldisericota bacterium]
MKVRIKLFQDYKRYHDTPDYELDLPEGTTAGAIVQELGIKGPELAYLILILKGKRVLDDYILHDGDELVFAAPIGGG